MVGQCLANDAQIQQQHYKVAQPISVEPAKIERSAQTAPQTQQEYVAFLQVEIKKHWHPPNLEQPYQNTVSFSIKPDGQLAKLKLIKPSGSSELDDASLFAVKAAFPLPPLPSTLKQKVVTTELSFDYKIDYKR